jgi:protein SCO1/2
MRVRAKAAMLLVAGALALSAAAPARRSSNRRMSRARDSGTIFALTDATGKPRTLADYRGKVVVLFFGYTQCPDVCPTTLAALAQTMRRSAPTRAASRWYLSPWTRTATPASSSQAM